MASVESKAPASMNKLTTEEEKIEFFKKYKGLIFDLDGTLWRGNTLIPGAKEIIELLRSQGHQVFFVTNNSTKSRVGNLKKMTQLGLSVYEEEVYGSSFAAARLLTAKKIKKAYVIGESGIVDELQQAGITVLGGPADNGRDFDWSSGGEPTVEVDPEIGAVVVGLDRAVSYYKLQYALTCLMENKALFVATNTDARGNLSASKEWAGAGTMVAALIGASEVEPVVVGKPTSYMLDMIVRNSGIPRESLCVVGDRLDTDILWGNKNGCGTLCVLTGVTSQQQLDALKETNLIPQYVAGSVADLVIDKDRLSALAGSGSCSLM